jgi:hypothetical protein
METTDNIETEKDYGQMNLNESSGMRRRVG